MSPISQKYL